METARIVLAASTCFLLLVAGLSKITGQPSMRAMADHLSIAWGSYRKIGVLEVVAVAGVALGFWLPWLGVVAGAGVVLLMVGAVVVHARARDDVRATMPALALLVLAGGYLVAQLLVLG